MAFVVNESEYGVAFVVNESEYGVLEERHLTGVKPVPFSFLFQ
jgi:hypothetical protein